MSIPLLVLVMVVTKGVEVATPTLSRVSRAFLFPAILHRHHKNNTSME